MHRASQIAQQRVKRLDQCEPRGGNLLRDGFQIDRGLVNGSGDGLRHDHSEPFDRAIKQAQFVDHGGCQRVDLSADLGRQDVARLNLWRTERGQIPRNASDFAQIVGAARGALRQITQQCASRAGDALHCVGIACPRRGQLRLIVATSTGQFSQRAGASRRVDPIDKLQDRLTRIAQRFR